MFNILFHANKWNFGKHYHVFIATVKWKTALLSAIQITDIKKE